MSRHASPRRRRKIGTTPWSVGGLVAVGLLLLMPGQGTFAYWSDEGTLRSADFTSGTVDVSLDGNLVGAAANGGTWTQGSFALATMLPGESRAVSFAVGNAGTANLTYGLRGSATGALAPAMRYSVYVGGAATNTGTAGAGNRTGACGGTLLAGAVSLGGTESTILSTRRALNAGAAETACLVAKLDLGAASNLQGTTATASFVFDGRQVGI